jgi:hypothetical protein
MPSQQVSHDLAQTCRRDVNAYNYDVLYTNEWRHYSTLFSTSPRSTQRSLIIFKCGGILINKWGGGHPPPHTPPHSTTLHHTPPHSTTLHHTPQQKRGLNGLYFTTDAISMMLWNSLTYLSILSLSEDMSLSRNVLNFSCSSYDFKAFFKFLLHSLFQLYCRGSFCIGGCEVVILSVLVFFI